MGKKRILAGVLAIAMTATMALSGCGDSSAATDAGDGQKADYSNEEYVWVSCLSNQSMFVNSDQAGLKQFAEDYAGDRECLARKSCTQKIKVWHSVCFDCSCVITKPLPFCVEQQSVVLIRISIHLAVSHTGKTACTS